MDRYPRIIEILQQVTSSGINPSPEQSLFAEGLIDSFALVDLVSALEKAFSIKIGDADLSPRKFDSVQRIAQYLEQRGA